MQQLDIFEHSRDLMLRNDLLAALLGGDAAAVAGAAQALAAEFPDDPSLEPADVLLHELQREALADANLPFAQADDAAAAETRLQQHSAPAAARLFQPADAQAFMRPRWAALARRAAGLSFDSSHPGLHPAPWWLLASDAQAAREAVQRIPAWRRQPVPLAWMAEAEVRCRGLDAAWPLLAELCWLAPRRFAALAPRLADPAFGRLMRRFEGEYPGFEGDDDWAWFPAWCLIDRPALLPAMESAQGREAATPAAETWSTVAGLLRLERQGRQADIVAQRRRLKAGSEALFTAYMRTR